MTGLVTGVVVVALAVGAGVTYRWAAGLWQAGPTAPEPGCQTLTGEVTSLTIEQSGNAAIIAGIAARRGLIPRAVAIAITTAYQESGIRNLDYGDRDSLGMFQQRPSMGWGKPEQVMDPFYSTGKFFDVMVRVDDWQTADIGDVAQAVQRSGYPDAYDKHIDAANQLTPALTGELPAAWSCVVTDPAAPDPDGLASRLEKAYGAAVKIQGVTSQSGGPASITVTTKTEAGAWSVAAFAQSWATDTGVSAVTAGIYEWRASADTLAEWVGIPASAAAPTTVVITF